MQNDRPIFASGSSPTGDAAEHSEDRSRSVPDLDDQAFELGPDFDLEPDFDLAAEVAVSEGEPTESGRDLGHLVILLLASTLAGLRDRLEQDGFEEASALVADLTTRCDDFLAKIP